MTRPSVLDLILDRGFRVNIFHRIVILLVLFGLPLSSINSVDAAGVVHNCIAQDWSSVVYLIFRVKSLTNRVFITFSGVGRRLDG